MLFSLSLEAQQVDSLPEVKVSSTPSPVNAKNVMPVQQFQKNELQQLNSLSVADAVKYFAGANVKDYGGIGGLKTVSIRSLGANHTGVDYDGIIMSDAQGGQIDLGKLSLDNITNVSLINSNPGIFMPARSFAYGSLLQLKSLPAKINVGCLKYTFSVKSGSFGFVNPAAKVACKWNRFLYTSLNAELQNANGEYPFSTYENTAEKKQRINTDIQSQRLELDNRFGINDSNFITVKAYYFQSERGLPGAVILNNSAIGRERLWDQNFFMQATWQKTFSAKSKLLVNGKYNYTYIKYLNPDYFNVQGRLENIFNQKEHYQSAVYSYSPFTFLSLSVGSDYFINTLNRTDEFVVNFAEPVRKTWLNNFAIKFITTHVEIQGNILYSRIKEKTKTGNAGSNYEKLTPALSLSWKLFQHIPIRVRMFYKNIFRIPTFNDLYYTYVGNTNLRPEFAKQYNAGVTWQQNTTGIIQAIELTTDAYRNIVTDKIVAVPRQNLFQWSMQNIGKVEIKGLDVGFRIISRSVNQFQSSLRCNYTLQKAVDVTDKSSAQYNNQIPYTPIHSGAASLHLTIQKYSINYNVLVSGSRYKNGENNIYNLVDSYVINDVSFSYNSSIKTIGYTLKVELNNLLNKHYEVIQYYPMPGINYRIGIILNNK